MTNIPQLQLDVVHEVTDTRQTVSLAAFQQRTRSFLTVLEPKSGMAVGESLVEVSLDGEIWACIGTNTSTENDEVAGIQIRDIPGRSVRVAYDTDTVESCKIWLG